MNILPVLAGIAFTVLGLYLARNAFKHYKTAVASSSWPSVQGSLIEIRLWGTRNIEGQMVDAEHLKMKFQYEVGGREHKGTGLAFYTLLYPETINFAKQHSLEKPVRVYYNPDDPADSVLICGPRPDKPYSDFILAALGLIVGIALVIMGLLGKLG